MKYRSVSKALPGPIMLSHQPGSLSPSWNPAAWASPVRAWRMRTAFDLSPFEGAVGFIGERDGESVFPLSVSKGLGLSGKGIVLRFHDARTNAGAVCLFSSRPPHQCSLPVRAAASALLPGCLSQGLIDIFLDVLDVLDADREADVVFGDARFFLFGPRQLLMGG